MSQNIEKVAVLGAGVMGAQLAGHLANAGIGSYLFDINQELSEQGKESLTSLKPAPNTATFSIFCDISYP